MSYHVVTVAFGIDNISFKTSGVGAAPSLSKVNHAFTAAL